MSNFNLVIVKDYGYVPDTPLDWGDVGDIGIEDVQVSNNGIVAKGWLYYCGVTVEVEMIWNKGNYPDCFFIYGTDITAGTFLDYYNATINRCAPFPFYLEHVAPVDEARVYIHCIDIEDNYVDEFIKEYGYKESTFYELCQWIKKELEAIRKEGLCR